MKKRNEFFKNWNDPICIIYYKNRKKPKNQKEKSTGQVEKPLKRSGGVGEAAQGQKKEEMDSLMFHNYERTLHPHWYTYTVQ